MKTLYILAAFAGVLLAANDSRAQVSCNSMTIGNITTTQCSDGSSSTSTNLGGQTQTTIRPPPSPYGYVPGSGYVLPYGHPDRKD